MEFLARLKFKTSITIVSLAMIFLVVTAAWLGIRSSVLPTVETSVENELMRLGVQIREEIREGSGWRWARSGARRLYQRLAFYPGFQYLVVEDPSGHALFRSGETKEVAEVSWKVIRNEATVLLRHGFRSAESLFELVVAPYNGENGRGPVYRIGIRSTFLHPLRDRLFQTLGILTLFVLGAGFFISRWFCNRITQPVEKLLAMTHLLARGQITEVVQSISPKPLCREGFATGTWSREVPAPGICPYLSPNVDGSKLFLDNEERSEICRQCQVPKLAGSNELNRLLYSFQFMASEIRSYQERLRKRYEFEERLLEACPDGIVASDPTGRIILYNKGAERLLGYTTAEALYVLNARDFYPGDGARKVKEALLSDDYGGRGVLVDYNTEVITKDGRTIPIRLSATILNENGNTSSIVAYFHDLSELKAHMDALVRTNRELNAANRELERLNRYYLEMLGFVTHELKSPIANGYMSANALRQEIFGPLLPEQKTMVDAICANLNQSMEMIRHYLDLSRIERNEFPVRPQNVTLKGDVLEPVLFGLEPAIAERGMAVEVDVPSDLRWNLDPELFRGLLTNLLSNAVKYGEKDGSIRIRALRTPDGWLRLEVWNSGPGLSENDQKKLFRKFQRLPSARRSATRGTGLGLFICKNIVERHGGKIWVESAQGKGVNFIVVVPPVPSGQHETLPNGEEDA